MGMPGMGSILSSVGPSGGAAADAMVEGMKGVVGALMGPLNVIKGIAEAIGGLVALANPAVMERFMLALNDAMAIIGQILTPIMQALTVAARAWGDAMAGLQPVLQPIITKFSQFIVSWAQGFAPMLEAAAPLIQAFGHLLVDVISKGLAFLQGVVVGLIKVLSELFELARSDFDPKRNAQGAAVRQTNVGSVESFASSQFAAMIRASQGGGGQVSVEGDVKTIKDWIAKGVGFAEEIRKVANDVWEWVERQRDRIRGAANAANAVGNAIVDPVGAIKGALDRAKLS